MTPISAATNRSGKGQVEAGLSHSPKLRSWHLDRLVVVYVRQSSPQQVAENRESTDHQYALAHRAAELGWPPDHVLATIRGRVGPRPRRGSASSGCSPRSALTTSG
jgi:hypothetical protein